MTTAPSYNDLLRIAGELIRERADLLAALQGRGGAGGSGAHPRP